MHPAENPLVLRAHPFTVDTGLYPVRAGQSLQAMLDEAAAGRDICATLRVEIGGYDVPRSLWAHVKPKAGVPIHCTVMPAGGGASKILRSVLLIAVAVVALVATGGLFATAGGLFAVGSTSALLLGAGISIIGSLLINALIPPPKPPSAPSLGDPGRWNMLTGSSNQAAPYGAIPLVIGECKVFPPHAAIPYSETLGDTSYQRLMFDLGHGDLEVTEIKIGDTDIDDFAEVDYEITTTPTLYTSDVNEVAVSAAMNDGDSVERTTSPLVEEISLDVVFGAGLFGIDDKGKIERVTAYLTIEYRLVGDPTWVAAPVAGARYSGFTGVGSDFTAAAVTTGNRKPFAVAVAWPVAQGQYEVRVSRGTTNWEDSEDNSKIGDATWTVLRSIKPTNPSTTGTTKLAMRIKATDQLNGVLQTLSCVVHQKVAVYDPDTETWGAPELNYNPAWVYYWLLTTCPALSVHVAPERVDLDGLIAFADFCTANVFETRGCQDSRTTARQLIDDVLSCALGALTNRDGKYGVLFDDGTTLPTMTFTPHDSRDFRASRVFNRLPHALKVRFRNPAAFWDTDEIIVLDDGYSYRGVDAHGDASADPEPTEFETLELRMVCDAHSAWRAGRFHLAQAKFRSSSYQWETDIANLACTRGDCVHVAHDVTEWGDGWGRVLSLVAGGPDVSTLTLDESIVTDPSASYSVRIRLNDGSSVTAAATPHSIDTTTFYLDSLPAGVNEGDIAIIGQTGRETAKLLVTGIRPSSDLAATISAVAYDDRVAPYWADPPDSIVSEVTGTSYRDPPPAPEITIIISDPINNSTDDAGIMDPEVTFGIKKNSDYLAAYIVTQAIR